MLPVAPTAVGRDMGPARLPGPEAADHAEYELTRTVLFEPYPAATVGQLSQPHGPHLGRTTFPLRSSHLRSALALIADETRRSGSGA
jgi:hypothetical protein